MKLTKGCIAVLLLGLLLTGCSTKDFVIHSLPEYTHREFYTYGGFQDFTDYGIYTFSPFDEAKLEENLYFEMIADVEKVMPYIENFENRVRISPMDSELVQHYDFDKTRIDGDDYYYIDSKEGEPIGSGTYRKFDNYDVYFFDTDSWTLYYFHSNI